MSNRFAIFLLTALAGVSASADTVPSDSVSVRFRQSYSVLDPTFSGNGARLDSLLGRIRGRMDNDSSLAVKGIRVIGGASPEGTIQINRDLSRRRAEKIFNWFSERIEIQDSTVSFKFLGRDWNGLLRIVESDERVPYKDDVEILIKEACELQAKDGAVPEFLMRQFKNMHHGEPYAYLYKTVFPSLRESTVIVNYDHLLPIARVFPPVGDLTLFTGATLTPPSSLPAFPIGNPIRSCKPFYMDLKTNLLYDAALLPTIGAEFYVGKSWSVGADWTYGWWDRNSSHYYWRAYGGDVYVRRWFGEEAHRKPLTGHHIGLYAGITTYDFEFGKGGMMGGIPGGSIWDRCMYLAGIEYGYSLPVSRRLNIDFTLGVGYLGGKMVKYEPKNGYYQWKSTHRTNWIGPTKAEISLVWLIGCDNYNRPKGGE